MTFKEWLEIEHPGHSVYDHDDLGGYRTWLHDLEKAFEAGRRSVIDRWEASMAEFNKKPR